MTATHRRPGIPAIAMLLLAAAPGPALASEPARRVLGPGSETVVSRLLAPRSMEGFSLGPWALDGVSLGPGCEVRFVFARPGDGGTVTVRVAEDDNPAARLPGCAVEATGPPGGPDPALVDAFVSAIGDNRPDRLLASACTDVVEGAPEPPACDWTAVGLGAGGLVLLVATCVLAWRRRACLGRAARQAGAAAAGLLRRAGGVSWLGAGDVGPVALWGLVVASCALRLWMVATFPFYHLELNPLRAPDLAFDNAAFGPPLEGLFTGAWSWVGGLFGAGMSRAWFRLPNVFLGGWLVLLLVRMGRTVGAPWAGWWSAVLLSFLPAAVVMGATRQHYFPEMVATAWFLEVLLRWLVAGRPAWIELTASALLALWIGYMPGLVIGPGWIAAGVVAVRRRRIRDFVLASTAFGLLYLPLIGPAFLKVWNYVALSSPGGADAMVREGFSREVTHPSFAYEQGTWRMLVDVVEGLYGWRAPVAIVVGLVLVINLADAGAAWALVAALAVFVGVGNRVYTATVNQTAAWPLVVFLPAWALDRLRQRLRTPLPAQALQAAAVAVLLWGAWDAFPGMARNVPMAHVDLAPVPGWMAAEPLPGRHLLWYDGQASVRALAYRLCGDAGDLDAFVACAGSMNEDWVIPESAVRDVQVLVTRASPGADGPDAPTLAVLCRPDWRASGFWVLAAGADAEGLEVPRLPTRCTRIGEAFRLRMFRCDPLSDACPGGRPP